MGIFSWLQSQTLPRDVTKTKKVLLLPHLVIESNIHHHHLPSNADPARATGVVGVHTTPEPHLDVHINTDVLTPPHPTTLKIINVIQLKDLSSFADLNLRVSST